MIRFGAETACGTRAGRVGAPGGGGSGPLDRRHLHITESWSGWGYGQAYGTPVCHLGVSSLGFGTPSLVCSELNISAMLFGDNKIHLYHC